MDLHTIDWHARQALRLIQPEALMRPEPINAPHLVKHSTLLGVTIQRGELDLMGDDEGRYYPADRLILLREDHWEALHGGKGDGYHRSRSTLAHELGHHALRDDPRVTNDENDAWAFAGCLMMPCEVVADMTVLEHTEVARTYDVSPQFAHAHLRRMKRAKMI